MDTKPKNFRSAIEELERQATDRIEETFEKIKPHIDDITSKVGDEFHTTKDKVEKEVLKNPWAAIGIVALVCFILGLLFSPKGRSRD